MPAKAETKRQYRQTHDIVADILINLLENGPARKNNLLVEQGLNSHQYKKIGRILASGGLLETMADGRLMPNPKGRRFIDMVNAINKVMEIGED